MYGTVARLRPLPGREEEVRRLVHAWWRERAPKVPGALQHLALTPDTDGEHVWLVCFQDRESYHANARDPEQDAWYRELRALLAEDPVWLDGEIEAVGRD